MEILGFQKSLLEFQEIHNHQKTFLAEKRKWGEAAFLLQHFAL